MLRPPAPQLLIILGRIQIREDVREIHGHFERHVYVLAKISVEPLISREFSYPRDMLPTQQRRMAPASVERGDHDRTVRVCRACSEKLSSR